MYQVDNILYADVGKVLDFKEPQYALNEDHELIQVHLYSPLIRMTKTDKAERYIEVDRGQIQEGE